MTRIAIDIQHVDVLFGHRRSMTEALQQLDAGGSRETILASTSIVLGVADASLKVAAGDISVLMGLSGSGKSSLLRCVNGLNQVTRGSIKVHAGETIVDVAGLSGRPLRALRRQHLAMVFQQFALLPWATVRENIAFGLSVRGETAAVIDKVVDEQLELVHLEAWADKPIHTLSGGMQQRVGLARAFATDADILLMDEPFSALDPLIREHLQDELLALQQRMKKTILFVSHDLEEALKIGNQISIMDGGRIVQTGSAADIVFTPGSDYVRRFVANINPLSVLTAAAVMRPLSTATQTLTERGDSSTPGLFVDGDMIRLPDFQCEIRLVDGALSAATIAGNEVDFTNFTDTPIMSPMLAVVPGHMPIRDLLHQACASLQPVLVTDKEQLIGIISATDILAALLHAPGELPSRH